MKAEITELKTKQTKFEHILPGEVFEHAGWLWLKGDRALPIQERFLCISLATGSMMGFPDDTDVVRLTQTQGAKFERLEEHKFYPYFSG